MSIPRRYDKEFKLETVRMASKPGGDATFVAITDSAQQKHVSWVSTARASAGLDTLVPDL